MLKKYVSDLKKEFSGYNAKKLSADLMSGLTVAAVALPLALAFGVSSGADAASGLITAIIAGIVIGLLGGASYQISGPTGAMAAILLSLAAKHGVEGVFFAGFISGAILIIAAVLKVGKLVSYIPAPVITGFTSGIAIIIALGQIDNFFGTVSEGENAVQKLLSYGENGFVPDLNAVLFGALVVVIMIIYPKKLNAKFPASLASIIIALIVELILKLDVKQVGDIPKTLLLDSRLTVGAIVDNSKHIKDFISPAVSVAALGMIESLLCGASAGKMKNEKIDAQRELIAQGIGNMIIPLCGGVPATAAIARTSVAIKSGGNTRLVSVFHSVTLIASMFLLGPVMSKIPLAALAGVLMVTAWRMNEWSVIKNIFSKKLKVSATQFIVTMLATVIFDLTIAIAIGVVLSMFLFILKNCELRIDISDVDHKRLKKAGHELSTSMTDTKLVYLAGPLFFGTQEKLTDCLSQLEGANSIVFSMRGVPMIDDSAIGELEGLFETYTAKNVNILFSGVQPRVRGTLERAGFIEKIGEDRFYWDAVQALAYLDEQSA
ncbi:MAG: SulP family inorganic anion transporter [Oscillospiraceae bacterium]|nr:SulP family inorganic anion transporter [Oscillospiraceae bacterium]